MEKDPKLKAEKEAERQRFLDFIGPKPDLTEIAEKTGILRQTLYYITVGERSLSIDIHREMARAFKSYDLSYQILGVKPEPKPVDKQMMAMQAELDQVKLENKFLKEQRDQYASEKTNYWKLLEGLHDKNSDFSEVSSQTTDTLFPMPKRAVPTSIDEIDFQSAYTLKGDKKPVTVSSSWKMVGMVDVTEAIEV